MRGLIYGGRRTIRCEAIPDPTLADHRGAIVKITLCAICGSDLHPYHTDSPRTGYCVGHEAVGEVIEVGRDVKAFRPGDRVLLPGTLGCGLCRRCQAGEMALCEAFPFVRVYGQGVPDIGGCQAEAVAVPVADANLAHLRSSVSDEVGIMLTDNLATAWFAARRPRVALGDVVAVIGLGSVGLQCVMAARAMGSERVLAIDLLPERRARAAALGAEPVDDGDVRAAVLDITQGRGPDVVIDANGGPATTVLAIQLVARGGRVSVVGVSENPTIDFPIQLALAKNLEFHTGACSIQAQLEPLMAALEDGRLRTSDLENLVTHRVGLSEGAQAYALFDARRDGVLKVVLDPSR